MNRLELSTGEGLATERYKKIVANESAMDDLLVDVFLEAFDQAPARIVLETVSDADLIQTGDFGELLAARGDCQHGGKYYGSVEDPGASGKRELGL